MGSLGPLKPSPLHFQPTCCQLWVGTMCLHRAGGTGRQDEPRASEQCLWDVSTSMGTWLCSQEQSCTALHSKVGITLGFPEPKGGFTAEKLCRHKTSVLRGVNLRVYMCETRSHLLPASEDSRLTSEGPILSCGFPEHPPSLHLCMLLLLRQELFVFAAFSRVCSSFISVWHLPASCRCRHAHI